MGAEIFEKDQKCNAIFDTGTQHKIIRERFAGRTEPTGVHSFKVRVTG